MFKAVILLTRRADMTAAGFREWWLEEHAPLARQLPGCRRLVFNVVEPDAAGSAPPAASVAGASAVSAATDLSAASAVSGTAPPCDGISELWFDSREAFDDAYATELGRRVAADTLAHVRSRVRMFVEERPQVG